MSQIHCKLVFRQFKQKEIDQFHVLCRNYTFKSCSGFNISDTVHYGDDVDAADEREETTFSFLLPKAIGDERYRIRTEALSELTSVFESFQKDLRTQNLADSATVCMIILSKNIYPQFFDLVNVFNVGKIVLGSIINRRYLAPSFLFDEPKNGKEVFDLYLDEHRDYRAPHKNMLACFEHDRESFVVCFPDIMKGGKQNLDDQDGATRSNDRVVDLRVSYSAIRRLIVTMRNELNAEGCPEIKVTFTFQISTPPFIYIHEKMKTPFGGKKLMFKAPSRFLTWNRGLDVENSFKYGSSIVLECSDVDPRTLFDCLDRLRKNITSAIEFRFLDRKKLRNIKNYNRTAEIFMKEPVNLEKKYQKLYNRPDKYFPLVYAIQALISRGGEVFEYFFRPEFNHFGTFLDLCIERFEQNLRDAPQAKITKTVVTLESMLQLVDRLTDIPETVTLFDKLYDEPGHRTHAEVTADLDREGYMRVRKLIITPTRHLYVNPELIMGNRSLRKKGPDSMLRVVFREDDLRNKVSGLPPALIINTVKKSLNHPLYVGMIHFSYLCSSNSQMRDHGCYFLAGTAEEVSDFRESCGRFKVESIPKMMSRLAQCFTQARQLGITITRNAYSEVFDYEGGSNGKGKPYCFSDGVGIISLNFCESIVRDLRLGDSLPSCYQIRFRGYKGVVLKSSFMEEVYKWAVASSRCLPREDYHTQQHMPWYAQSILFRPSQSKFHAPREKHVEIVKISAPIPVSLNKPLINILDQVSEMHGPDSHKQMCNRIFELLELHMEIIVNALIDEPSAFLTLNEFPKYILYDRLRDFYITEEPFFRSMLRSSALVGLNRLVDKMQIRIPTSQGRMMFGVVDETGLLQYGQVFFQYTVNPAIKYPGPLADKIIHHGPVLITKNPSVVAGDVRMFDAIDLPCLHDLVDVIVFPQSGPRPHPDEMAGSDLDGDEYSIFWDPKLFLDRNEPAFDFTSTASNQAPGDEAEVRKNLTKYMVDFFTSYVQQDSIGSIANSHLANSDLYGINSKHCHNIAIKHNQAVDFPKTGQVPDKLRKDWDDGVPPERIERFPNFMCKTSSASYKSTRLLGDLFNRVTEVQEILRVEELISSDENILLDESVLVSGDEVYEADAFEAYGEYSTLMGGLMDSYGIQNEGQLFSGRFVALKRRISDKENDDMSLFNTQHMIEEQVAAIYAKFRSKFFDGFGGIEENTELDDRNRSGIREVFRRVCGHPKESLRKKASAYYRVAYTNKQFLSFGWLVSDILVSNRQQYLLNPANRKFSFSPLSDRLSEHIKKACMEPTTEDEFKNFDDNIQKVISSQKSNSIVNHDVARICKVFDGLQQIIFFIRQWAIKHKITEISPKMLDIVVVKFGLGEFQKGKGGGWLTNLDLDDSVMNVDLDAQLGGIGKKFLDFIRFIMTRSFGFTQKVSLEPFSTKTLDATQCLALYYAAMDTFYPIAVNRRFDSLPGSSKEIKASGKVTEGNLFVIEIPQRALEFKKLFQDLAIKCNCKYVVLRKKPVKINSKNYQIAVKPVGSFLAVRKFRSVLEVAPRMDESNLQKRSEDIANEVYQRLLYYTRDDIDINSEYPHH